jgi:4-hydroxybenzoate polyprenyltransferase
MNVALLFFVVGAVLAGLAACFGETPHAPRLLALAVGCISAGLAVIQARI